MDENVVGPAAEDPTDVVETIPAPVARVVPPPVPDVSSALRVTRADLAAAFDEPLGSERLERAWSHLVASSAVSASEGSNRVTVQSVAWYAGGTISLLAMSVFLGTGWASYGPRVGLGLALLYLLVFIGVAEVLRARHHAVPAGILATVAVGLVPLVVFAFEEAFDLWPTRAYGEYSDFYSYISSSWAALELATVLAAVLAWRRHRVSFLLAPLALAGWFMSMDLADAMGGELGRSVVASLVAALFVALGVVLDRHRRTEENYRAEAFWLHLAGLLSVSYAVTVWDWSTGLVMGVLGALGVLALAAAVTLRRRLHLVFGGVWLFTATSYLAFDVFGDSLLFPLALAALGVGVVLLGIRLGARTAL